jgi:hypothetical protein
MKKITNLLYLLCIVCITATQSFAQSDEVMISDALSKWMPEKVMGSVAKNKSISAAFEHFKQKIESRDNQQ